MVGRVRTSALSHNSGPIVFSRALCHMKCKSVDVLRNRIELYADKIYISRAHSLAPSPSVGAVSTRFCVFIVYFKRSSYLQMYAKTNNEKKSIFNFFFVCHLFAFISHCVAPRESSCLSFLRINDTSMLPCFCRSNRMRLHHSMLH